MSATFVEIVAATNEFLTIIESGYSMSFYAGIATLWQYQDSLDPSKGGEQVAVATIGRIPGGWLAAAPRHAFGGYTCELTFELCVAKTVAFFIQANAA